MRRANAKDGGRLTGLERYTEDDNFLEQHDGQRRISHTGENLLARFNRLARDLAAVDGIQGEVCGFEGTFVCVRDDSDEERVCQVRRILKKTMRGEKSPFAVGDRVVINQLQEGDWVIEGALPRRNQLERADSHNKALAHVFGANVDHLVIVSALRDPVCKPGLIDRYLLIAEIAGVEPTIVLNKTDLADPAPIADLYRGLDYPVFTTDAAAGTGQLEDLRDHLAGGACIFCGQSGVGKSSLIRALYPAFDIRIGAVSEALGKGRHTTTAARSYLVDDHTRLIDTPGIRECGIRADDAPDIALRYRELAPLHRLCQFNDCTHTHEPACAVKLSVADGSVALSRYASYLAMLENDLELPISGSEEVLGDYTEPTDESSEDDGQSNQQGDAQAEAGP